MATSDVTNVVNKNNVNYDKQKVIKCHTYQREIETEEVKKSGFSRYYRRLRRKIRVATTGS